MSLRTSKETKNKSFSSEIRHASSFLTGRVQLLSMDYQKIIDQFYPEENALKRILLVHSRQVAERALHIIDAQTELSLDRTFVSEAAMLHDIGIFLCDAKGIQCFGTEPYICHGRLGAELLRKKGWPRHARVCERHTGAGLTKVEILAQELPLPAQDFLPETMEEKLICYADKFYSKTKLGKEKTLEQAVRSLSKFGTEGVERFLAWQQCFEPDLKSPISDLNSPEFDLK